MKISIITPSYNYGQHLESAIESVLTQDYSNWEHIIIDGGSTDNTIEILKKYNHVKWISEPDEGIYDALNKGIKLATGDYLYFLGCDDVLHDNKVLSDLFDDSSNNFDFIYGNVLFKESGFIYSGESSIEKLVKHQISICHQSIFYSKRIFSIVGEYDLKYFVHADFDFNVRCFENQNISKKFVNRLIAVFNEKGISGQQFNADNFHNDLGQHYIDKYSCPMEVMLEIRNLKMQNEKLRKNISFMNKYKAVRFINFIIRTMSFGQKK